MERIERKEMHSLIGGMVSTVKSDTMQKNVSASIDMVADYTESLEAKVKELEDSINDETLINKIEEHEAKVKELEEKLSSYTDDVVAEFTNKGFKPITGSVRVNGDKFSLVKRGLKMNQPY